MINITNGCAPGPITPIKKGQGAYDSKALKTDINKLHFRIEGSCKQAPDGNAIANQIARLALAGHVVHKGSIGDFTVCKYGLSRYCEDFAELQAFALKLGVRND